jgi:hypothetical protein
MNPFRGENAKESMVPTNTVWEVITTYLLAEKVSVSGMINSQGSQKNDFEAWSSFEHA